VAVARSTVAAVEEVPSTVAAVAEAVGERQTPEAEQPPLARLLVSSARVRAAVAWRQDAAVVDAGRMVR
jgi:hypothetical protein